MIRIITLILGACMLSCYSIMSEFEEQEANLDYTYYISQAWNAFESVTLHDSLNNNTQQDNIEYYKLGLEKFYLAIQAINSEFQEQDFIGPHYEAYNGIGWTQLYYANELLEASNIAIRDSLRNTSVFYFDSALTNIQSSSSDSISSQDWCDIYSGLSYNYYYKGLDNLIYFDDALFYSHLLITEKPHYTFSHAQLDYRNIHYLRGKIFLSKEMYEEAYNEIKNVIDDCEPYINDEIDIELLLECFDQFSND